ncbi:bifunctional peptidase and (3S)-lysyl hydroxylase Jmjd7 isoform X2 [Rosa chinensis]|uniref:bifunctional peptidase and (3S)-lysyl hydroxylase Jmjd7 isoform X2 n=1 Tax=Rosa chinensis TaxID=74649 RepID=UPI001AD91B43|nr:bifunctional peptidase and (3S)-lysyl hydroxylase Jmjd7 isoform X2 [Rosa chinensis]
MEESLRIRRLEEVPPAKDFTTRIESRNIPAVIKGCVKDWGAVSKWNPSNGGLEYLQERVGLCVVEAMLSSFAPVFYGDLRSHERVPLPFSAFIRLCRLRMHHAEDGSGAYSESERTGLLGPESEHDCKPYEDAPQQIYLAQVPIISTENEERVQLETLREDIQMPAFLEDKSLISVNLWMNNAQARSSTHYDPHHNLLCIVSGCKQVVLWPPSATPVLYPMPIYGEASNHSSVPLDNLDFSNYPRAESSMEYSQKVILHAGDALFIPEGWFHQVDSDDLTIAVNFWWQSNIMSCLSEHMDAYYLRVLLRRMTIREMNQVLPKASSVEMANTKRHACKLLNNGQVDQNDKDLDQASERKDLEGKELKQETTLHELEPVAVHALHELVSLVHSHVNAAEQRQPEQSTSTTDSALSVKDKGSKVVRVHAFRLEDDPVANIIWTLPPCTLQRILLAMVVCRHCFCLLF